MREDYLLSVKKAIGEFKEKNQNFFSVLYIFYLYLTVRQKLLNDVEDTKKSYNININMNQSIYKMKTTCTSYQNDFDRIQFSSLSPVDFVLKDQREKESDVEEKRPPHREEMDVVPKPWHKDYVAGLEAMSQKLHITTPCMLQVLDFWHTKFG